MSTDPKTVQAARLLIARLGLTPQDLMWVPTDIPTFADYVPTVIAASGPGAARTYGTYWTRITEAFGEQHLDEVTANDIEALKRQLVANRRIRRNDRGGQSVAEHLVSAMRAVYTQAISNNLLPPHHNPALKVTKPRPRPVTRYALAPNEVAALADVVAASGRDAVLDTLLFRLHLETACRRGGALALREEDIEPTSCLIRLREKNNTVRMQPVSPTLIASLLAHRQHRGNGRSTTEPLLRHHNGNPINRRRYDRMWQRLADRVPWVGARNISTHWLRHTTLTWVDRHYGPSITRGYAGHADPRGDNVTGTYTKATLPEIATALAAYTREPHPLAITPPPGGGQPLFPAFTPVHP